MAFVSAPGLAAVQLKATPCCEPFCAHAPGQKSNTVMSGSRYYGLKRAFALIVPLQNLVYITTPETCTAALRLTHRAFEAAVLIPFQKGDTLTMPVCAVWL